MSEQPAPPSLLRRFLRISLIAALALLGLLLAVLLARPELMLFHPLTTIQHTPEEIGWDYERVELHTDDGETLVAWYLPAPGGSGLDDTVVLYCHGNAGNIGGRLPTLQGLQQLGVAVLMLDYRGYGESSGRPTVAGTLLDVAAAWSYLVDERGHAPGEIVLWGRSLGGAVAIEQAARASEAGTPPRALVVESSFTSTLELGEELHPLLPVRLLGQRLEYRSRERIAEVDAPILIAHSPDDDLIGFHHGQGLHAAAETAEPLLELSGGHNHGHATEPRHHARLLGFLSAASRRAQPGLQ